MLQAEDVVGRAVVAAESLVLFDRCLTAVRPLFDRSMLQAEDVVGRFVVAAESLIQHGRRHRVP